MGINNALGLLALVAIPLVIFLYMLRPKHLSYEVSSHYIWQRVLQEMYQAQKIDKLRKTLLFFLDILIVLLITAILSGLFLKSDSESTHYIVILDGSLSMQATDTLPNRFAKAQTLATDFIDTLQREALVSLVFIDKSPQIIHRHEVNKQIITASIAQLKVGNNYCDEKSIQTSVEALNTIANGKVVYFGDNALKSAINYDISTSDKNFAIVNLATKKIAETLSLLTVVENRADRETILSVSIYCDDLYFTTKEVTVAKHAQSTLLFNDLPPNCQVIKAQLDNDDILLIDNTYYTVVDKKEHLKIAYVSSGNLFIEKILNTHHTYDVYKLAPEDYTQLEGYDIYIFESFLPSLLPKDGNILMIDPPDVSLDFSAKRLGYVENPILNVDYHAISQYLKNADFNIAVTQVYQKNEKLQPIFSVEQGCIAYSALKGNQKIVVYGFDFRYSDLPLNVAFPILMNNTLHFLKAHYGIIPTNLESKEVVDIHIFATTKSAKVTKPSGLEVALNLDDSIVSYHDTYELGVYKVLQASQADNETYHNVQHFIVNPAQKKSVDSHLDDDNMIKEHYQTHRELQLILVILLVLILVLELFLRLYKVGGKYVHIK